MSAAIILSLFAFACASSYLTVIKNAAQGSIHLFLVLKHPDFPDLEQGVPSSMADAVRKEISNTSEEETAHISVSLSYLAWQSLNFKVLIAIYGQLRSITS